LLASPNVAAVARICEFIPLFRQFSSLARLLQSFWQLRAIRYGEDFKVQDIIMLTFDKSDFQRFMVAAVGALALTAASVIAAAGPAKAAGQITTPTTFAAR
jgi:hypothetical protein